MADDERSRLLDLIEHRSVSPHDLGAWLDALCCVSVDELGVDDVAVSTGPDARGDFAVVAASSRRAQRCAETELGLASGPSRDASAMRRPVLVRDLQSRAANAWPDLADVASDADVRSVYAFPLQLGALRIGVLTAYVGRSGMLTAARLRTALLLAQACTLRLIDTGDGTTGDRPGDVTLAARLDRSVERRSEIFQAQGMIAAAAGTDLTAAMAMLRAHAFAAGRGLAEVAVDVVGGQLDLSSDTPDPRHRGVDNHQDRDEP